MTYCIWVTAIIFGKILRWIPNEFKLKKWIKLFSPFRWSIQRTIILNYIWNYSDLFWSSQIISTFSKRIETRNRNVKKQECPFGQDPLISNSINGLNDHSKGIRQIHIILPYWTKISIWTIGADVLMRIPCERVSFMQFQRWSDLNRLAMKKSTQEDQKDTEMNHL